MNQTVLEFVVPTSPVAPTQASAPKPARDQKSTLLGVSVAGLVPNPTAANLPSSARSQTVLGFPSVANVSAAAPASVDARGPSRTMLGIALPGIAPLHIDPAAPSPPPTLSPLDRPVPLVVPAPIPLAEPEPLPLPPTVIRRQGLPLAAVGVLTALLVLAGGALVFWMVRPTPLLAHPELDPDGRETLVVRCESCRDGVVAELDGVRVAFASGYAPLPLAVPLKVGANPLTIRLERPRRLARFENVRVVVPVSFRIRPDLAPLQADRPAFTLHVEATPGARVEIDGTPVPLDALGIGGAVFELGADAEGPSDESKVISRTLPYSVAANRTETGNVAVRFAVTPLRVDAPGSHAIVDTESFFVAGRAARGSSVTVNGLATTMTADGAFEQKVWSHGPGDVTVRVRTDSPPLAPRTVVMVVRRVANLEDETGPYAPSDYDVLMSDLQGNVGKLVALEGDIVDARAAGHRTVLVLAVRRGCAKAPCLARVVGGNDTPLRSGEPARAYGRVLRPFSSGERTVPEIDADFVLRGKAK
ncbi:MAG: hypothetical protein WCI05_03705 [Myxococcales bacterium]